MNPEEAVGVQVQIVVDQLTDEELVALNMAVLLDSNPVDVYGYDKAKSLFTEQNKTRMHSLTKSYFLGASQKRLGF